MKFHLPKTHRVNSLGCARRRIAPVGGAGSDRCSLVTGNLIKVDIVDKLLLQRDVGENDAKLEISYHLHNRRQ